MEVILLEKVQKLGNLGDKVVVKAGYGRNCLIPQKKAVFATTNNIQLFEQRRAELEKQAQKHLAVAEQRAAKLNDVTLTIAVMTTNEGKLYGSIGVHEIMQALKERNIEINKRELVLANGPLYNIGDYLIDIKLHNNIEAKLQLKIIMKS